MDAQGRLELEAMIASIPRDGMWPDGSAEARRAAARLAGSETVDPDTGEVLQNIGYGHDDHTSEPFGRWLLAQRGREDWIDLLADAARRDPSFPKSGSPDEVRHHLERRGCSDPDVFEQLDDAERVWSSL